METRNQSAKLSPFNWSLNKLLLTEPDIPNQSRLKIIFTILVFSIIKTIVVIPIAFYHDQHVQMWRSAVIFAVNTGILKLLLSDKRYASSISHAIVWMGLTVIWTNLFLTAREINFITIQISFMVMLSSFYLLNTQFGVMYSMIGAITLIGHLIFVGDRQADLLEKPEELLTPAFEIIFALNFITICISLKFFHDAFNANINEKNVLNSELKVAVDEARRLAKVKSDFLSTMSHELRTPLNSVIGMTELLSEAPRDDDDRENLEILAFSAMSLRTLINDILDFNKIESGKLQYEALSVNLTTLIERTSTGLRLQAHEGGLAFNLEIEESMRGVNVITDPTRITQIIYNLVGNAIKFTPKGYVSVSLKTLEKSNRRIKVRFSVADTGVGISKEKHEKIFEAFTQASADTTRNFGGTGLGLAIVKSLVGLFNSKVQVESRVGNGSTFYFDISFKIDQNPRPANQSYEEIDQDLKGLRVLVAEDNPVNVQMLKKILIRWNVDAVFAGNGIQALEKVQSEKFDIILMDIHMPFMDGFQATKEIRKLADPNKATIPIIVLTAAVFNQIESLKEIGFTDHIYKPLDSKELYSKLEKIAN